MTCKKYILIFFLIFQYHKTVRNWFVSAPLAKYKNISEFRCGMKLHNLIYYFIFYMLISQWCFIITYQIFFITGILKIKMQSNIKFINFGKISLSTILRRHIIKVTFSTVKNICTYMCIFDKQKLSISE